MRNLPGSLNVMVRLSPAAGPMSGLLAVPLMVIVWRPAPFSNVMAVPAATLTAPALGSLRTPSASTIQSNSGTVWVAKMVTWAETSVGSVGSAAGVDVLTPGRVSNTLAGTAYWTQAGPGWRWLG